MLKSISDLVERLDALEAVLDYKFEDRNLLLEACSHCSFSNENRSDLENNNERLEFLGDAVLGMIVSHFLHQNMTDREGRLSSLKSSLVDAKACREYVLHLGIDDYLLLGKGERQNEGRGRETLLADFFEAIIGAIFLDGGFVSAEKFFLQHFIDTVLDRIKEPPRNWKAELQDLTQKHYRCQPSYELIKETGPDHSKLFVIGAYIQEKLVGTGTGNSKKQAEQEAAKCAVILYE
ncbi:MAG: ribonuclease III [Simkaniaceae bacterium]|nr:ribonuclease III [Simkaniaceae bacterium]